MGMQVQLVVQQAGITLNNWGGKQTRLLLKLIQPWTGGGEIA